MIGLFIRHVKSTDLSHSVLFLPIKDFSPILKVCLCWMEGKSAFLLQSGVSDPSLVMQHLQSRLLSRLLTETQKQQWSIRILPVNLNRTRLILETSCWRLHGPQTDGMQLNKYNASCLTLHFKYCQPKVVTQAKIPLTVERKWDI